MRNLSKPVQYLIVIGLAVAAWLVIGPLLSPNQPTTVSTKKVAKKKPKKSTDIYLPEDRTAHFDNVVAGADNIFKPLVAKSPTSRGGGAVSAPNALPAAYAGGEPNWIYTGTADVDGVPCALLENKTTGDSLFLRVGDTWKGSTIQGITDDSLIVMSPETGLIMTVTLPSDDYLPGPGSGNSPVTINPLNGPIGGPMTIEPDLNGRNDNGSANGRRNRRRGNSWQSSPGFTNNNGN